MRHSYDGFPRITLDPEVMAGQPCIRGMRITASVLLENLAAGVTIDRLLELYPYLERDDVLESLRFASWLASGREIELATAA